MCDDSQIKGDPILYTSTNENGDKENFTKPKIQQNAWTESGIEHESLCDCNFLTNLSFKWKDKLVKKLSKITNDNTLPSTCNQGNLIGSSIKPLKLTTHFVKQLDQ